MDTTDPLWRETIGYPESWRRGRLALIVFGLLAALSQLLGGTMIVMSDRLDLLIGVTIWCAFFWLEFYLIWIGVVWVRWLAGTVLMLSGLAQMICVIGNYSGLQLVFGVFNFALGAYVGFAPSVFFFARRQREKRDWFRATATAAVFLLLIVSLVTASFGLRAIKLGLQRDLRILPAPASTDCSSITTSPTSNNILLLKRNILLRKFLSGKSKTTSAHSSSSNHRAGGFCRA